MATSVGNAWPRCSLAADAAGDPREGTAAHTAQWLLVEHPGPWRRAGLAQSGFAPASVAALSAWAAATDGRVTLIRRPGRRTSRPARRWFRVDSRPGRESVRTGTFVHGAELVAAVAAPGTPHPDPLFLVCTHGRRDTCCAVRGRPLAAALATVAPEAVWECSHLGGCRFAPAMVLLPHGYVLGGVEPGDAAGVALAYRSGRVEPRFVRGRAAFPPAVQAAQHHARAATGAVGVDALRPVHVTVEERPGGSARWEVEFTGPACSVLLEERRIDTGRPLTCAATQPGRIRVFDLARITVISPY